MAKEVIITHKPKPIPPCTVAALRRRGAARALVLIALLAFGAACATHLISPYSETAYSMAVSLKVDALELVALGSEPFDGHRAEVAALRRQAKKNLEYAKGRPNNEDTAQQWEILLDPSGALLGGYLARWEREKTLGAEFAAEKVKQIGKAFDEIIRLESHKSKGTGE